MKSVSSSGIDAERAEGSRPPATVCFLSYSPLDSRLVARLEAKMTAERGPRFDLKHRGLDPGALEAARAAIVIVSGDYLASPSLSKEAGVIAARRRAGTLRAVGLRARVCDEEASRLGGVPVLPDDGTALSNSAPDSTFGALAALLMESLRAPPSRPDLLDDPEYPWADPRAAQLHELLTSAYTRDEAIRYLAATAAVDLDAYERNKAPKHAWQALLELAAKQRRLRPLLQRVLQDRGVAAYHEKIRMLFDV